MFIKYNGTNVHALADLRYRDVTLKNKKTGKKRTVKQLEVNQSPQDVKWLRPGWNQFPKRIWDQHKEHPQIQHFIKTGVIEVMSERVTVRENGKKVTKIIGDNDALIELTAFDDKKAVEIIKATYDRQLLQRWLDEESRGKVRRALEKQLKPLLPDEKADEDDDEDDDAA